MPLESAKSSPACPWPDRSQSSFPCSPARSPKPPNYFFRVCASSYLKIASHAPIWLNRRQRKRRSNLIVVLFVSFCSNQRPSTCSQNNSRHSDLREAMSNEKRYFTSDLSNVW